MQKNKLIYLFFIFTFPLHAQYTLIFDLGNVLMHFNSLSIFSHFSLFDIASYKVEHPIAPADKDYFSFLSTLEPLDDNCKTFHQENCLPQIISYSHRGDKNHSSSELKPYIQNEIMNSSILSPQQKDLFWSMTDFLFDAKKIVSSFVIPKESIEMLTDYKEKGYKVYLVSNIDEESYYEMKKQHPEFITLFDKTYISALEKKVKPDVSWYQDILEGLDPSKTVFIDDTQANLNSMQTLQVHTILCKYHHQGFNVVPYLEGVKDMIDLWINDKKQAQERAAQKNAL